MRNLYEFGAKTPRWSIRSRVNLIFPFLFKTKKQQLLATFFLTFLGIPFTCLPTRDPKHPAIIWWRCSAFIIPSTLKDVRRSAVRVLGNEEDKRIRKREWWRAFIIVTIMPVYISKGRAYRDTINACGDILRLETERRVLLNYSASQTLLPVDIRRGEKWANNQNKPKIRICINLFLYFTIGTSLKV